MAGEVVRANTVGSGAGAGNAEQFLYGLMAVAEEQQGAVQAALAGLAAERASLAGEREALGQQAEAVRGEALRLRQVAAAVGPEVAQAARAAVEQGLAGAGRTAAAAVETAAQPVLERLEGVAAQAGAAEAALRRVVGWASWRLLGRGLAMVVALGAALWLAELSVWWWAERDLGLLQAQRAVVQSDLAGLQGQRTELAAGLAALEKAGGLAKLTRCGPAPGRLCIRVEDGAGAFTNGSGSYRVIQGY